MTEAMWKRLLLLTHCFLFGGVAAAAAAPQHSGPARPRLAVIVSIDQFRADYLTRFADLFLPAGDSRHPGGFRYLQTRGAWYPDCQYEHHRTVTAVGHSILGTGAQPYVSGIVGNNWWDAAAGASTYCVSDPRSSVVGAEPGSKEKPMSAANLLVTTLCDELELATGGRARTVSLSLKDRAAILMSGHRTDTVLWFDEGTGGWISSSAYFPAGKLPAWVQGLNAKHTPERLRQTAWTPSVNAEALERVWNPSGRPVTFSHALTGTDYFPFATSPAGNTFVLDTAREAVRAEKLGQDELPDLLTINLASNDYVGHRYGPDSAEVLDITVQTDRQLAAFLQYLADSVPGGLGSVTFAVSADHGVVNIPELNLASRVAAGRAVDAQIISAAQAALATTAGPGDWIAGFINDELYFREATVARYPRVSRAALESAAAEAVQKSPAVMLAVGKSAVLSGRVPQNAIGRRITNGVHARRSGDVIVILDPQWLSGGRPGASGTSHGTPFTYDTHVPLLVSGFGIRPGTYGARVSPARLAPSLAHLMGVARPSAADEPLLPGLAGVSP